MFPVPGIVAFGLLSLRSGPNAALKWLRQLLGFRAPRRARWLMIAIGVPHAILLGTYLFMQLSGQELPNAQISPTRAGVLLLLFLLPALFEEVGWSGYALTAVQPRTGALRASLIVGCVWAVWHLVPLVQVSRSPEWIAWWSLTAIELRVLISWVFNNSSSVLVAATFHASENAAWQLFPSQGSHYDPKFHAVVLLLATIAVVARYGSSSLVRLPTRPSE